MKKFLFPIVIIILSIVLYLFVDHGESEISAYAKTDSHLLQPEKNVVIVSLNLEENSLELNDINTISILDEFNKKFLDLPGVNRVDSILNATVIIATDFDIEVRPFLDNSLNQEELTHILSSTYKYPELLPYISADQKNVLFYIYFGYNVTPANILSYMEDITKNSPLLFSYTGKAPILAYTEKLLSNDILLFLPILFIIIMIIFLNFKSFKAITLGWLIILLSVTFSFSIINFIGIEITPLVLLVPVFALGLLSDYIIHYIYHLFYAPHMLDPFKVRRSLIYPLGLTALSTLMGFFSLVYINASGHILLGAIVGLSVLFTFIGVTLWLPYFKYDRPNKTILPNFSYYQSTLFNTLFRFRKLLYILLLGGVIWGLIKLPSLKTEPYPIDQLPKTSMIREAEEVINNSFYGSLPFFIEIDGGSADSFLSKDALITLNKVHAKLSQEKEVGYSYSLLTILKRIHLYFFGDEDSLLTLDADDDYYSALIQQYLLYYSSGVDPLEYESMVDPSFRYFSVKGYIKYDSVSSLINFYKTIEEAKSVIPDTWNIEVHGIVKELNNEKNGLTQNWVFSFVIGSFLIFITVLIFYKKLNLALLSLVPSFISMILSFGIISSMNLSIDSFSIIFVAIITGLVIDYSIHTLSALDKVKEIPNIEEGFKYINSYSGIPIYLSFLTSLFSFSVLFLSSFKGAKNLGLLLFASLIISYILSLYLLPILVLPSKLNKENK